MGWKCDRRKGLVNYLNLYSSYLIWLGSSLHFTSLSQAQKVDQRFLCGNTDLDTLWVYNGSKTLQVCPSTRLQYLLWSGCSDISFRVVNCILEYKCDQLTLRIHSMGVCLPTIIFIAVMAIFFFLMKVFVLQPYFAK